jgi:hypothetical protein
MAFFCVYFKALNGYPFFYLVAFWRFEIVTGKAHGLSHPFQKARILPLMQILLTPNRRVQAK